MIKAAVILAAGVGSRLGDNFADRPKGLLQIGDRPIIEQSIRNLAQANVRDILIVTGHRAGHFENLECDAGVSLRTLHNPRYAECGSMYSLYCARHALDDAFLLLESDLIYEPRALTELLAHPADDAILLSSPTGAGDEVWVATKEGRLEAMSKDMAALGGKNAVAGELVGISKISSPLFQIMLRKARRAFTDSLHYDYETDCLVAAAKERPIECALIADLVWAEIDDPKHLRRAREIVYPELQRRATAAGERPPKIL
ncbi:MAG: phosphocholine cytidylyltransferase family protein [Gammaproteobacteria bacterium]|nr:phosphocholine cytidylyltransferase family protein [Gammaproteobacteria bacterium]MDH3430376.1 phosphocholine cytidylyltransferase family protein [Gammaproteobacteria bacterium]